MSRRSGVRVPSRRCYCYYCCGAWTEKDTNHQHGDTRSVSTDETESLLLWARWLLTCHSRVHWKRSSHRMGHGTSARGDSLPSSQRQASLRAGPLSNIAQELQSSDLCQEYGRLERSTKSLHHAAQSQWTENHQTEQPHHHRRTQYSGCVDTLFGSSRHGILSYWGCWYWGGLFCRWNDDENNTGRRGRVEKVEDVEVILPWNRTWLGRENNFQLLLWQSRLESGIVCSDPSFFKVVYSDRPLRVSSTFALRPLLMSSAFLRLLVTCLPLGSIVKTILWTKQPSGLYAVCAYHRFEQRSGPSELFRSPGALAEQTIRERANQPVTVPNRTINLSVMRECFLHPDASSTEVQGTTWIGRAQEQLEVERWSRRRHPWQPLPLRAAAAVVASASLSSP